MNVLIAPRRQLTYAPSDPHPPWEIPTRIKTPRWSPKSIVSPARNTHIPILPSSKLADTSCGAWVIPISTAEFVIRLRSPAHCYANHSLQDRIAPSTPGGAGFHRCGLRSPILFHSPHAILVLPRHAPRRGGG